VLAGALTGGTLSKGFKDGRSKDVFEGIEKTFGGGKTQSTAESDLETMKALKLKYPEFF